MIYYTKKSILALPNLIRVLRINFLVLFLGKRKILAYRKIIILFFTFTLFIYIRKARYY